MGRAKRTAGLFRFWRHLAYHRHIIKHVRWTTADEQRLRFYSKLFAPGDLVFDVGANMGNRSKIFRAAGARVIAFEPQSYCARFLDVAFRGDPEYRLVREGLSNREGEVTMQLSDMHVLSSIDPEWIGRMQDGGRFSDTRWDRTETIRVTTLDRCIERFGLPAFVKIDVEGHEYSVIQGLSQPVAMLSLEFASESIGNICNCIDHLDGLGRHEYRLSMGESMQFEDAAWNDGSTAKGLLQQAVDADPLAWGDLYARHAG